MSLLDYGCLLCVVQTSVEGLWSEQEVWRMELYLSVGIMALGMLSLLAITSLPSVANTINWREFSFIQVHTDTHAPADTHIQAAMCWLMFHSSWIEDDEY